MKKLSAGAILACVGAVVLAAGLAVSSTGAVSGAGHPDVSKVSCRDNSYCIEGYQSGSGSAVEGYNTGEGTGIYGYARGKDVAIYGFQANGNGVKGVSGGSRYPGVFAENAAAGDSFEATSYKSGVQTGYFYVDGKGNAYLTGAVHAHQAFMQTLPTSDGNEASFSAQSTRATIEDTGTARLMNGEGAVRFDPAFARVLDLRQGYQVFLTPDGDTRGLYVAAKYEGGFIVRETERGHRSIDFDYRVVAHPVGSTDIRLPRVATEQQPLSSDVPQ